MTPCVRIKDGVTFDPMTPGHVHMLAALERAAVAINKDLTVTSARDSHPMLDVHGRGLALDVRVFTLTPEQLVTAYNCLKDDLGPQWTVLYEVQFMPKGALADIAFVNPNATGAHLHIQLKRGLLTYPLAS